MDAANRTTGRMESLDAFTIVLPPLNLESHLAWVSIYLTGGDSMKRCRCRTCATSTRFSRPSSTCGRKCHLRTARRHSRAGTQGQGRAGGADCRALERKLAKKNEVVAGLLEGHLQLERRLGSPRHSRPDRGLHPPPDGPCGAARREVHRLAGDQLQQVLRLEAAVWQSQ